MLRGHWQWYLENAAMFDFSFRIFLWAKGNTPTAIHSLHLKCLGLRAKIKQLEADLADFRAMVRGEAGQLRDSQPVSQELR